MQKKTNATIFPIVLLLEGIMKGTRPVKLHTKTPC